MLEPHISCLPQSLCFTGAQLHQLRSQISAFKAVLCESSLSSAQLLSLQLLSATEFDEFQQKHLLSLLRAKATQRQESFWRCTKTVPGVQSTKEPDFYFLLRAQCVEEEECGLLRLKGLQEKQRATLLRDPKFRAYSKEESFRCLEGGLLDRAVYRRELQSTTGSRQEIKVVAKCEQSMRNGQESKKRGKERQFLLELLEHHREFFDFHVAKHVRVTQNALKKRVFGAKNFLENVNRQESAKLEKSKTERFKALKENDFETYIDLVYMTKNEQLLKILNQTDQFFKQLGAKVLFQKGEGGAEAADCAEAEPDAQQITENLKNSSRKYYEMTHTIQEEVKEQPAGLHGGVLKSYQLSGLQ